MPAIMASIFSTLIILMTVSFMIKVLLLGYKRKEISFRRLLLYVSACVAVGAAFAISLPFVYTKLFHWVLGA